MDFTDQDLIEAARMGGRSNLCLSESTQAGLRCGGKTGLAMAQAKQEYQAYLNDLIGNLDHYMSDVYKAMVHFDRVTRPVYLMKTKSKQSRYVRVWRK